MFRPWMISVGTVCSREKVASFIRLLLCAKHSVGSLSFPPTLGGSHHLHFTEQPQLGESRSPSGVRSRRGKWDELWLGGCCWKEGRRRFPEQLVPMRALGETGQLLGRAQARHLSGGCLLHHKRVTAEPPAWSWREP